MQRENRNTQQTNRPYIVYLPDNMGTGPYPLVLVQHGGGTSAELFAERSGKWDINGAGSTNDFILVFTQATELPNSPGSHTWNAGFSAKGIADADDISYINNVLSEVCTEFPVQRANIFACGNSNGGMFTYRMAKELSEWFKGIAVAQATAGGQRGLELQPHFNLPNSGTRRMSVFAYHNEYDDNVRYLPTLFRDFPANLTTPEEYDWYLTGRREIGFWPSVGAWLNHNGIAQNSGISSTIDTYTINEWVAGNRMMKTVVNGDPAVGHTWPTAGATQMLQFFTAVMAL
jgi:poly(3-hydroxybutyrate) depolymerase